MVKNALEPGIYLQVGDSIKSVGREYLGSWSDFANSIMGYDDVGKLAAAVGWVFVALNKRKAKILEIPNTWKRGDDDIELPPFRFRQQQILQQTDESLQLNACAYYFKQRQGGRIVGLRWLRPDAVRPDYDSPNDWSDGVTQYKYIDRKHNEKTLPAKDIIEIKLPGMAEMHPGTPAGLATRLAALVLRGIDQTSATFFGNNALPVSIITVPVGTGDPDVRRLEAWWKRLTNQTRGTDHIRATALRGDIKIDTVSMAPKDLAQKDLEEAKIDLILAAHDVPKSVALSNAANYATDMSAAQRFTQAIGARFQYIADAINDDPDIASLGVSLVVQTELHSDMKEDEVQRAQAFTSFVTGGMTTRAAAYLVGIDEDDFPTDFGPIFEEDVEKEEPTPVPPQFQQESMMMNDDEHQAEMKAFRNWLKKRDNPDIDAFRAYHMTDDEKEHVYWQVKGRHAADTITDDMIFQFTETMRRLDANTMRQDGTDNGGGSDNSDEGYSRLSPEPSSTNTAILE